MNMNPNEIKKALECLCGTEIFCKECKYSEHLYYPDCRQAVAKNALDLINRQKAEIERLVNIPPKDPMDFCGVVCNYAEELIEKAKSEAVKEFVEKVLNEIRDAIISNDKAIKEREEKHNANRYEDNFCSMCDGKISALGGIRYFINNLVKEMVGDDVATK